jgi:hypothetical protein
MSRKGHYHGGGTNIGPRDKDWFGEGSTVTPPDGDVAPKPAFSLKEQTEFNAFKKARKGPTWTIVRPRPIKRKTRPR